jgi:serine/threonine-protein kinase
VAEKYRVEEMLGAGGMGCVYRAEHAALRRTVALKVLHPHLAGDPSVVQRFLREARAASRLGHPNIVTLLDFGQDADGLLYLVMEFVPGRPLDRVIAESGPLAPARIAALAAPILLAMDEAHAHGVVHRDLKPENVIVVPSRQDGETVKVVDFGIARVTEGSDARLTATGMVFGTPSYMSPEQARGEEAGPASDLYSFGVMLFELATGRLPFEGQNAVELLTRHLGTPPPDPRRVAPGRNVPDALAAVILRCLEKDPARRFPGALQARRALLAAVAAPEAPAAGAPVVAHAPTELGPASLPPPSPVVVATGVPVEASPCGACGHPIAPGARFCAGCGATAGGGVRCPACGAVGAAGERFCAGCGAVLGTALGPAGRRPSFAEAAEPAPDIRASLPAGVADALTRARAGLASERREAVVLFADLRGFAPLAAGLDPEAFAALSRRCFDGMLAAVESAGGAAERFLDEAVMGVFGVPAAREDDDVRAVRAAFAVRDAALAFARTVPRGIELRVGVHRGPVLFSPGDGRLDRRVAGEAVSAARALAGAAAAGSVVASTAVAEACRGAAEFRPLAAIRLEGLGTRLGLFEAAALRDAPPTPDAGPVDLVGRTPERARIDAAAADARAGRGAALWVSGEGGIGKSVLLRDAAARLARAGFVVHAAAARPFDPEPGVTGRLVRSLIGLPADASSAAVAAAAGNAGPGERAALERLAAGGAAGPLDSATADAASAAVLRRLLRSRAARMPLALLIDDVRRLDERRRRLWLAAAEIAPQTPFLLLAADRSEPQGLPCPPSFQPLPLGPLDEADALRLLARAARGGRVPPDTARQLIDAAGGNPLHLEEMARLLDEHGGLAPRAHRRPGTEAGAPEIPRGLRALALARADALPRDTRALLIQAAVVGRRFPLGLLSRLAGEDAASIDGALRGLVDQGILDREPGPGAAWYRFRHEALREALYDLVTRDTRRAVHGRVAGLLLAGAGGDVPPEETAVHLERAGREGEAAESWARAAETRLAAGEPREAAARWQRAVEAGERARKTGGTEPSDERCAVMALRWAETLVRAGLWDAAESAALRARAAAQTAGEPLLAARAARPLARSLAERGRLPEAAVLLAEAQAVADESGAAAAGADLAGDLGEVRERSGDLRGATTALLAAVDRLQAVAPKGTPVPAWSARLAETLNRLGRVSLRAGRSDEAHGYFDAAHRAAADAGDPLLAARVLGNLGALLAAADDPAGASDALDRSLVLVRTAGDRLAEAKLLHNLAQLAHRRGDPLLAASRARESYELSVELAWREGQAMGAALLESLSGAGATAGRSGPR